MRAMDLLTNWSAERDRPRRGLSLLSNEQLTLRLRPSGMSISEMVCHLATGEWFWFAARADAASPMHRRRMRCTGLANQGGERVAHTSLWSRQAVQGRRI